MSEHYDGCICVNGEVDPDCTVHRTPTMDEARARFQVGQFLKERKEADKND